MGIYAIMLPSSGFSVAHLSSCAVMLTLAGSDEANAAASSALARVSRSTLDVFLLNYKNNIMYKLNYKNIIMYKLNYKKISCTNSTAKILSCTNSITKKYHVQTQLQKYYHVQTQLQK